MYYDTKGCKSLSFVRDYDDMPLLGEYGACGIIIIHETQDLPSTSTKAITMYQASGQEACYIVSLLANLFLVNCQLFAKRAFFFSSAVFNFSP